MRLQVAVLALLVAIPASVLAHAADRKAKCDETKLQIGKIEAKMRQGYSAREGVRLEDRLRRLKEQRAKRCR